ncbi:hypothetical protein [Asaia krungthepensis]|uniref:Alpha/beta hydrolase n=1 Tax=Asaia krungthepensis NRIC 0535 TaxID=1307925 RepID=A0ABQ0Q197_9PROT|nr:hypothetical protein [Asaia krungthepensis]GBQ86682.1 hypothetical protein AA0535_1079 [Asaia krungthepensis NRIC 0535]
MAVIYEGEDLVVHETDGDSDYAVITFGAADHCPHATTEFYAQAPLRVNNIKSIGICTKKQDWFISPETDRVIALINEKLAAYTNRVVMGFSMGAHPALKWSRRLQATSVFAMVPKYSLDPDLCWIEERYVRDYFTDSMKGMHIAPEDVGGRVFITYDPEHKLDCYHAELIAAKLPDRDITMIKSFHTEHEIPQAYKGRHKFRRVMTALANGTRRDVVRTFSQERRTSLLNLEVLIRRNTPKHPRRAFQALTARAIDQHDNLKPIFGRVWELARLSHRLSEAGFFEQALTCRNLPLLYLRFGQALDQEQRSQRARQHFADAPLGFHGHLLCYDIEKKAFIGRDLYGGSMAHPLVKIRHFAGKLLLEAKIGEETAYLYEKDGQILMSDDRRDSGFVLEKSARNAHHHIRSRLGYLSSHPYGHYDLRATNKLEWEEYAIPSEWR